MTTHKDGHDGSASGRQRLIEELQYHPNPAELSSHFLAYYDRFRRFAGLQPAERWAHRQADWYRHVRVNGLSEPFDEDDADEVWP
jgi:hypothetical protein